MPTVADAIWSPPNSGGIVVGSIGSPTVIWVVAERNEFDLAGVAEQPADRVDVGAVDHAGQLGDHDEVVRRDRRLGDAQCASPVSAGPWRSSAISVGRRSDASDRLRRIFEMESWHARHEDGAGVWAVGPGRGVEPPVDATALATSQDRRRREET